MGVHDYEDFLPPAEFIPPADRWGTGHDDPRRLYHHVSWDRLLWADYLDKNTNFFQCVSNSKLSKIVLQKDSDISLASF